MKSLNFCHIYAYIIFSAKIEGPRGEVVRLQKKNTERRVALYYFSPKFYFSLQFFKRKLFLAERIFDVWINRENNYKISK